MAILSLQNRCQIRSNPRFCTCGQSKNPPFCDGSHKGSGKAPKV
ncbi:MAG: CDGSH iron-sulfur domain-containing protein, partial [Verrucomicrobia bacterium]|nr:CDGSH iron-sulfur domain-containing protein [Verrucomicrobiota bacterium]